MNGYALKITGVPEAAREYGCEAHGPFEVVVELATSRTPRPCPTCGAASERTLNATIAHHVKVSVSRGKSDPPPPGAMDTRALAEGKVTLKEFRAKSRTMRRDARWRQAKQKGLIR